MLDYPGKAPLYDAIEAEGSDFLLVQAGFVIFFPDKSLHLYTPDELLWTWPMENDRNFDHVITVFVYTPTAFYVLLVGSSKH